MIKFTDKDLKQIEKNVNEALNKANSKYTLKIGHRYNYTALDITNENGGIIDTFRSGMTNTETAELLYSIEQVLFWVNTK